MSKIELDLEELKKVYAETKSCTKTAKHFGVSKKTVLNRLRDMDVPRFSHRKMTLQAVKTLLQMADDGFTATETAKHLGISSTLATQYAKQHGKVFVNRYHAGYITTWNGYKRVFRPEHPKRDSKGYVLEHILVVEQHLGRALLPNEVVHHKDKDKFNNALSNLEVMTRSEHAVHHAKQGEIGWALYHSLKI